MLVSLQDVLTKRGLSKSSAGSYELSASVPDPSLGRETRNPNPVERRLCALYASDVSLMPRTEHGLCHANPESQRCERPRTLQEQRAFAESYGGIVMCQICTQFWRSGSARQKLCPRARKNRAAESPTTPDLRCKRVCDNATLVGNPQSSLCHRNLQPHSARALCTTSRRAGSVAPGARRLESTAGFCLEMFWGPSGPGGNQAREGFQGLQKRWFGPFGCAAWCCGLSSVLGVTVASWGHPILM